MMSSVTDYAIDFDFVIDSSAQGMCFGMADTGTFVMWQVNAWDNRAQGQIILRPHFKRNGGWVGYPGLAGSNIKNVDVTAAIGYNHEEVIGKTVYERIEVSGKTIKTYFGKDADNLVLADTYTHTSEIPLNNIGFRHNSDNSGGSAALWATTARTRPIWPS